MARLVCTGYVLLGMAAALVVAAGGALAAAGGAAAQPQPTMVLSPSSGPCDAAIQVSGSGFPVPGGPMESLGLYLVQPGTADLNMGILNAAFVERDGTFSQWVGLQHGGCDAAALDNQSDQPTGNFFVAARSGEAPVAPGERIPDIIAVARYTYATTAPHVSTEALTISPSSGPCDGAVEVRGSGFEPGTDVLLKLGRPGSDDTLGTLASATADSAGGFVVQFTLGDLGCRAAELDMTFGDPARPQLGIGAYPATYPTPAPQGIPPVLAVVAYSYTSAGLPVTPSPRQLPVTGTGPVDRLISPAWPACIGVLAALGLAAVVASLCARRMRS
jgi:hypothetical protein